MIKHTDENKGNDHKRGTALIFKLSLSTNTIKTQREL